MRSPSRAVAAAVGLLSALSAFQAPVTLLTVPQRDRLRSSTTPSPASISADGRYIVFSSYERIARDDTDSQSDIYLLDRATGAATLVSVSVEGRPIQSDCVLPRISGDGRFVVFEASTATLESPGIVTQIVLSDLLEGTTSPISRSAAGGLPDGQSAQPALSDDAGTIAFASTATNLLRAADANGLRSDVYTYDPASGRTRLVSIDHRGVQPSTGSSVAPSISSDGRYIAFVSSAALLPDVAGGSPSRARSPPFHVYVHDTRTGISTLVTRRRTVPDGSSRAPAISRDGRFIAFVSLATNLVTGDRNGSADVFLYERGSGAIRLVSRGTGGRTANGASDSPSISSDGRYVAFQSEASDLTCAPRCARGAEDINLLSDVFLFDRLTGAISRVSASAEGGWMEASAAPALDGTGRIVAFTSKHPIDGSDTADDFDLFVRVE